MSVDSPAPYRVQLQRLAGWRMPEPTKKVARTTHWGNPWAAAWQPGAGRCRIDTRNGLLIQAHDLGVSHYRTWAAPQAEAIRAELRSWNLTCSCRPPLPCHVEVLLEIANG